MKLLIVPFVILILILVVYVTAVYAVTCEPCPVGSYASKVADNNCTLMDPRNECAAGECPVPPPGYTGKGYQPPGGNMTLCTRCAPEKYADKPASTNCSYCNKGFEPDVTRTSCVACNPGEISDPAITGGTCTSCYGVHRGYYANEDHSACVPCEAGEVSFNAISCIPCDRGYWWNPALRTCLSICPQGYKCGNGTSAHGNQYCATCSPCGAGYVQPSAGQYNCLPCARGYHQPLQGQSDCQGCTKGSYQPKEAQADCLTCPEGYYCPNTTSAVPCPSNRICPAGSTSPKSCSMMFNIDTKGERCQPSIKLIAIITGSAVGAILLLSILVFRRYRQYSRTKRDEHAKLLAREQNKRPVYTGL